MKRQLCLTSTRSCPSSSAVMTCLVREGKCVCAWMISRKLTEGASSSLTTSDRAIWPPFSHDRDLLSICLLVWVSVCECVTLPACVQSTQQHFSAIIHVNTAMPGFLLISPFISQCTLSSTDPGFRFFTTLYLFISWFILTGKQMWESLHPLGASLSICLLCDQNMCTQMCYWIFYRPINSHRRLSRLTPWW